MKLKQVKQIIKNFANKCLQQSTTFLCSFLFVAAITANAEEFNMNAMPPPDMQMEFTKGKLNAESFVTLYVTIPDKWHVNANIVTDDFLKPSSVEAAGSGIEFGEPIWPTPIKEYNEALELEILVFKGDFQVKIPIKNVLDNYDSLKTKITFDYQACDNSICLAPAQKTITLESAFNILKSSTNASEKIVSDSEASPAIAMLLLFAFIGGIVLNLMPCVLPVLSLKLFGIIKQSGESRMRLLTLSMATTAGILFSFWTLAIIVVAIKISGGNAGWGMQFQSAGFIAFMVVILTAFAMSFFGLFEIWLPGSAITQMDSVGKRQGLAGAFFTGALLVLLSTPCSAPFLGTAMGFAFTASAPVLFLFFTAAGLGLALPYILVGAFPKITKSLPKPGKWMVYLQKVMGAFLLATVIWLLWIVNEQAGSTGVALFFAIVAITIICSIAVGKIAPPGANFLREICAVFFSAVAIFVLWFAFIAPKYEFIASETFAKKMQIAEDGWLKYSPKLIDELSKSGRTIFIDVTADWCLTCKANEAAVLNSTEFRRAIDSLGVVLVKADWTRKTANVTKLLQSMKKSGVPAYAIYPKGNVNNQLVLPELLTTKNVIKYFE